MQTLHVLTLEHEQSVEHSHTLGHEQYTCNNIYTCTDNSDTIHHKEKRKIFVRKKEKRHI